MVNNLYIKSYREEIIIYKLFRKVFLLISMVIVSILYINKIDAGTINKVSSVEEMINNNYNIGDIVYTDGYYEGDIAGAAKYKIVTYDEWYNELPKDIKYVYKDKSLIKAPTDEYGNHTLKNGLVAKLIIDSVTTPEQWGAIGDGKTDNNDALINMFAFIKTGKIEFEKDAVYMIGKGKEDNPYRLYMCGSLLGGQNFNKPIMGNVKDLIIEGNNATIKLLDNSWDDTGMGILNFTQDIENFTIQNLNFDGNCYSMVDNVKTSNHTIFYSPGQLYLNVLGNEIGESHYKYSSKYNSENLNESFKPSYIKNWSINNCNFKNAGTMVNSNDSGGDFILIVNPTELDGLFIENNKFTNWGRWVFSIDLGGNGERLYNIKFNNNTCIQEDESDKVPYKQQRGLGLIDFESKKCFSNLEFKNNYINGITGFAINGNSKITNNVDISNNKFIRPNYNYKSAYPYTFEFYSVQMKNLKFKNNDFTDDIGSIKLGYKLDNITVKNNKFSNNPFRVLGVFGNIIFDNNTTTGKELVQVEGVDCPEYIDKDDYKFCNFIYTNNIGGIGYHGGEAMFFDPDNPGEYSYIKFTIENNKMEYINLVAWDAEDFTFDTSQIVGNHAFSVRGAKFINKTYSLNNNPICGGGYYSKGDIIVDNLKDAGVSRVEYYYDGIKLGINNFNKYDYSFNNYGFSTIKCVEDGYLPTGGEFVYASPDIKFKAGLNVNKYAHIYTDSDLYMVCNNGSLGTKIIKEGNRYLSGDVYLVHLTNIAKVKIYK